MTIINGRYETQTKKVILDTMVAGAEQAFERELSEDEHAVFRSFYDPVAEYLANQQDELRQVMNSLQIDHADGEALDLLTALIGVTRNPAEKATSRVKFSRSDPAPRTYTIPQGTVVETDATDPLQFVTTTSSGIRLIDGFEDANLDEYTGDTSNFSTSTTEAFDGSNSLTASGAGYIYNQNYEIGLASTFHCRFHLTAGTTPGVIIGAQDADNAYRVWIDTDNSQVNVDVLEGGSVTDSSASSSGSIPTNEWVKLKVAWDIDGDIAATVYNAAENELVSTTLSESDPTYSEGYAGFYSASSNTKYYDNFNMSAVGVPVEAVTPGNESNVGPGTLTVMPTSPTGVETATNPISATGGAEEETDEELRTRSKDALSDGSRSTLDAIATAVENADGTSSVSVIANDTASTDGAGRPSHSFETIVDVDSENYDDVAEAIAFTKAAGDIAVGGYAGTGVTRGVEYKTGQTKDIEFSTPTEVQIYVDIDLTKTETYAGDESVRDSIVQYIGGTLSSGTTVGGELEVGDDVIYNQIIEAVFDVDGVHDASTISIDTSSSPTATSNISITNTEVALSDATDGSITIDSTDV